MWNWSWRRRSRLQAWPPGSFPTLSLQPSMLLQIWTVSCTFWGHTRISSCATLNPVNPGIVSGQYPLEEGPLSQMSEAVSNFFCRSSALANLNSRQVNNLDKLGDGGAMGPHTPCTPHTPGLPATPLTPGTGHKSPRSGLNRYFHPGFIFIKCSNVSRDYNRCSKIFTLYSNTIN